MNVVAVMVFSLDQLKRDLANNNLQNAHRRSIFSGLIDNNYLDIVGLITGGCCFYLVVEESEENIINVGEGLDYEKRFFLYPILNKFHKVPY